MLFPSFSTHSHLAGFFSPARCECVEKPWECARLIATVKNFTKKPGGPPQRLKVFFFFKFRGALFFSQSVSGCEHN